MSDLNNLVDAGDPLKLYTRILEANAINNLGQIVVVARNSQTGEFGP
jgi:hypothetical protein